MESRSRVFLVKVRRSRRKTNEALNNALRLAWDEGWFYLGTIPQLGKNGRTKAYHLMFEEGEDVKPAQRPKDVKITRPQDV